MRIECGIQINLLFLQETQTIFMNSVTRDHIIPVIQGYFATQPIIKAWLFGSYSRGEETTGSDVDILVIFDDNAKIGLFKYADMICQ